MIENPFIISGKVERKYFCDRKEESEELIRLLVNGHNIVLISPRRMGKTGLIQYCYEDERIKDNYYTFFIDILQTNTLSEFIFLLGKEIYKALAPRSKRLAKGFVQALKSLSGKIGFDSISGLPALNIQLGDINQPEITLEEIFAYLDSSDMRCIVAIDEFQQISNYKEKNIEAILRTHIQQTTNCNFIFSGSQRHILQEMFANSSKPFFNSATFMHLGPIPRETYVEFIEKQFEEFNKEIKPEEAGYIYDKFNGHTFYVQRTCNEAFSYTPTKDFCSKAIIDKAITTILNSYSTVYREILSQLPLKQKELLYAIASEGKVRGLTSTEFIMRHALQSSSSVQSSARTLLTRDLITRLEDTYSISDRFFQLWIQEMLR